MKDYMWAVCMRWSNRLDGDGKHLLREGGCVRLFRTRAAAERHIRKTFSYIRHRRDLRREPHGWRVPVPVKVKIIMEGDERWQL